MIRRGEGSGGGKRKEKENRQGIRANRRGEPDRCGSQKKCPLRRDGPGKRPCPAGLSRMGAYHTP